MENSGKATILPVPRPGMQFEAGGLFDRATRRDQLWLGWERVRANNGAGGGMACRSSGWPTAASSAPTEVVTDASR